MHLIDRLESSWNILIDNNYHKIQLLNIEPRIIEDVFWEAHFEKKKM